MIAFEFGNVDPTSNVDFTFNNLVGPYYTI